MRGVTKNQYNRGNCLKRGKGLGQFADLRGGGLAKKGGGVFEGREGVDAPLHTTLKTSVETLNFNISSKH